MSDAPDDPALEPLQPSDEFFVGYLPTPPKLKRFSLLLAGGLVVAAASIAASGAVFQRHPGEGLEAGRQVTLQGLFVQSPYPHLRTVGADGALFTVLTARAWKSGLGESYADRDGQPTELRGRLFARNGGALLVVSGGAADAALSEAALTRLNEAPSVLTGASIEVSGEIVDSKCFYGQMRPGDGRAHRGCAQLCIRGGIAPVLVTRDAEGTETHLLLANAEGGPLGPEVLSYVAEPVRIEGRLEQRGDLALLRIDSAGIHRY